MRKSFVAAIVLLLAGLALGAGKSKSEGVKLTGYIIDNACATKSASDLEKVKTHSKMCALMPPCVKSGYALVSDGKVYKLDKAGNSKAEALLKSTKSERGLHVNVEGNLKDDVIEVTSLSEAS